MDVEIGQLLDNKYRIVRLLGEGGMGAVYEGENVRIHHRVAIKVLHPNIAADSGARERFEREAQAAGHIGSEHIVEVFDLGELPSGARYMVMEFLAGEPLSARIATHGRIAAAVLAPLMLQLLDGLGAAHVAGIIHRDLKPENVFLQRSKSGQDFVKIVDFGVSKFNALSGGSAMSMTRTGAVVGTPYYMSPEQVKGQKNIDHRSDLYSAGIVLFESVTGQLPFQADTFNELIFKIALEPPLDPEIAVPGLDPEFAKIVRKSTAREANDRYQTAADFAQAIAEWMQLRNIVDPLHRSGGSMVGMAPQGGGLSHNTPNFSTGPNLHITPNPTATPSPALHQTTASGSVVTPSPSTTTRRSGGAFAIAAVAVVVLIATGVGVMRSRAVAAPQATVAPPLPPTPETPATTPPTSTAAAMVPTAHPAEPATAATLAPAASESQATDEATAHASATAHAANQAVPPQVHHPAAVATAAPATSAATSSTTIKGRTIRTEL
jgi:serine/threonine-protein kinase